ncbi:MAG: 7-carboxy-7-deazaguanine synthase [Syntrophaceae bacterium]|nr:7-carboxy-7-deazaguanine synthase [Syntrophaceae bacterium]
MSYQVKEIFYSLQGEGYHSGRPAVFCRFSGCNLWSGKEADRDKAICKICDTDFLGTDGQEGGNYQTAYELAQKIAKLWPKENNPRKRFVVFTGGEPLLQLDNNLIDALHEIKFEIAVETNGTIPVPEKIDWLCVSPKENTKTVQTRGNELKLLYPQERLDPEKYIEYDFKYFYLQPVDNARLNENIQKTLEYVLSHPKWRLSLQLHKILKIK